MVRVEMIKSEKQAWRTLEKWTAAGLYDYGVSIDLGYTLDIKDELSIDMHVGAEVLSVQVQGGLPVLWAKVNPNAPVGRRKIAVRGTGHAGIPPADTHIGTLQMCGTLSGLVFHFFDLGWEWRMESRDLSDLVFDVLLALASCAMDAGSFFG